MRKNFFRENRAFIITSFAVWIMLTVSVIAFPKPRIFLFLNGLHHTSLDYLFRIVTHLGDGIFVLALGILLFFARKRALSFLIISSYALSGLVVQLIKDWFPVPRPALYFRLHEIEYSYFIKDVVLHSHYSFPSGHTASAFALAASIAFMIHNKNRGASLAIGATIIGYSRIYLGQHFPEDVAGGMAIGLISTLLCYLLLIRYFTIWEEKLNSHRR